MSLDLPPIVQYNNPNANQPPPDMAKLMLQSQQLKQGALSAQHDADLPGLLSAYQGGDQSAMAQIQAYHPEVANSINNLAIEKQRLSQEGSYQQGELSNQRRNVDSESALRNTQIAGEKQKQQQEAITLENAQQDQQLQRQMTAGQAAGNMLDQVQKMRTAGADPSKIQDYVKTQATETAKILGVDPSKMHDHSTDYIGDPDRWVQDAQSARDIGTQAGQVRALRNMTPEQREFAQFQNMSPDDKRNYLAMKAHDPYALSNPPAPSAPAGPPQQGPTVTGQPIAPPAAPQANPNQTEMENKVDERNLDPAVAAAAKAFLRGDGGNVPGARALPAQKLGWQIAQETDGSLSAATYGAKSASLKAFTSGQESHNLNANITVVNHVADWLDNMKNLKNGGYKFENAIGNATEANVGPSASVDKFQGLINKADIAKSAVGSETAKAYKGAGAISVEEAKDWQDKLSHNFGPQAAKDNAAEIGGLLLGKLDALKTQWNETHSDMDFASKFIPQKTVDTMKKLGVDQNKIDDLLGDNYKPVGGKVASPTIPKAPTAPAGAGGVLHVDKNGNKAMVFPDGHYEEVK